MRWEYICPFEKLPGLAVSGDLAWFMQLNEDENKAHVARRKILALYFKNGLANMQELYGMDTALLPYLIAWAGIDDLRHMGLNVLYRLLRGVPSLFDPGFKLAKEQRAKCSTS